MSQSDLLITEFALTPTAGEFIVIYNPTQAVIAPDNYVNEVNAVPETFELSQNFPNPFNPTTTIKYGLRVDGRMTLKVYNLLGEKIKTLVNAERKTAGYHIAIWDGRTDVSRQVSIGVYFVQMRTNNFVQTRKMLLIQ